MGYIITEAKHIRGTNKYKYVYPNMLEGSLVYIAKILKRTKSFEDERAAAIYVDTILLEAGRDAVNILVKKRV